MGLANREQACSTFSRWYFDGLAVRAPTPKRLRKLCHRSHSCQGLLRNTASGS
jgi:hypothetical protein